MTNQESKSIFQEDIYDILTKGQSGERYRKQNTNDAIKRILLDKKLKRSLGKRDISFGIGIEFPEEVTRLPQRSLGEICTGSGAIALKSGSLELVTMISIGYFIPDSGWGEGDHWDPYFEYAVNAPIILTKEHNYPIIDFSSPNFRYKREKIAWSKSLETLRERVDQKYITEHGKRMLKRMDYLSGILEKMFREKRIKNYRVSDMITTTGSEILKIFGEQVIQYRDIAKDEMGSIK